MSQTDSFIDEVNDEVRRDRLFALMRRYGWIAVVVVIAIVGGAAWLEYSRSQTESDAQAFGDAILNALDDETSQERIAALQAIPTDRPGQAALVAFLASSEAAAGADDKQAAADALNGVGGEGLEPFYAQLAQFKRLMLATDTMEPQARREEFRQLAAPGSPLGLLAQEQIALTYVEEGDTAKAISTLQDILDDAEVTQSLRQRASQLMVALGGAPEQAG
ncbi:hypothetical protein DL237_18905 [Pseudooceanicola sediminis]|uniref:Ancillary SecYEG translocon subunit/Cell division coordinator CpoB TPR domain-containing protein n=1 Tax=Pseudooceanicola sediminis TaxID=2211117 RepID=A0A399IV94_9RHOB|nr:tetratricopeptide repeat protein [Pseudooceanicola sediminis]KAA2312707.1 hypothetical protein E0K93_16300 [Puniceibacterium sp. HSS470]RII37078.1 hypothetical protein DL237_18905 [Pseudooceanicola sediminis]